ncbi:hypothetical protein [Clostridium sp. YIM B02500]|uniref:hypothetical protein n=1 Tax=Clostridium sp. YIM B02500 TaxID=2910681 RepID=UPI001EEDA202|nr:hypothetical protein [Clostridium sp. YIM B02500]
MITEYKIKNITKPDIEINTNKNVFKINDIDLSALPYFQITFNNGKWFYLLKNEKESDEGIKITVSDVELNDDIINEIGKRIVEQIKEAIR